MGVRRQRNLCEGINKKSVLSSRRQGALSDQKKARAQRPRLPDLPEGGGEGLARVEEGSFRE